MGQSGGAGAASGTSLEPEEADGQDVARRFRPPPPALRQGARSAKIALRGGWVRLSSGARVGPYEVIGPLGAGGMGEVYRARDTRLAREVALKVISDGATFDSERLKRFEQEARLAGSLSHPNLVVVHDVGTADGAPFLVTELLEGESLRQRLLRGRLSPRTALDLGAQVAEGLAAAHARGVVHRDVKPENIFVTSSGRAKLLDFGIAKLTAPHGVQAPHHLLDTTLTPEGIGTQPGAVLGTPGYMSPEQVRGDPVDARTDIFSLGAVLYETLTGTRAFPGSSFVETGHAILESDPPPLQDPVPSWVDLVVRRCLEKEPARRFHSAADLAFALGAATTAASGTRPLAGRSSSARWKQRLLQLGAAAGILLAAAGVSRWVMRRTEAPELPTFERITFRDGPIGGARFTPEGRVVFSAPFDGEPEEVFSHTRGNPGLQTFGLKQARVAAVSPRTGELAVLLGSESIGITWLRGTLARLPATGGVPRELAENVAWADWTPSGDLAIARRGPGGRMSVERPIGTTVWSGPGLITDLRVSPDGANLAFIHRLGDLGAGSEIIVLDQTNKARVVLASPPEPGTIWSLAWVPGGQRLRFASYENAGTTLCSVSLEGPVHRLYRFPGAALLQDIAPEGTMLFTIFDWREHVATLMAGRANGRELGWGNEPEIAELSTDGRRLLFTDGELGATESFVILRDTDGNPPKVLGSGTALSLSPDGRTVAMTSFDGRRLFLVPTGAGSTEEIPLQDLTVSAGQWSRDGRRLWVVARARDRQELQLRPIELAGRKLLAPIPRVELLPKTGLAISSDDRWIAVTGADRIPILVPAGTGEPTRITAVAPDFRPVVAGWEGPDALWLVMRGVTPPRLVRVQLPDQKISRSWDIDLHQRGGYEVVDARISVDGSRAVVQYVAWNGRLELMHGIPLDR